MGTLEGEPVLIRVEGGHIHRAVRVGGALLSFESCNLDDAIAKHEIDADEVANAEPFELCEQPSCFPRTGLLPAAGLVTDAPVPATE
jgi:hypothetical protein